MDEKKIKVLDKIGQIVEKKAGFEVLNQPHTFEVWCGGKYVLITLHSIVDVHRGECGELFGIDSKYEIWDLEDFLNADQLEELLLDLTSKKVTVKMEVEVTFDVDGVINENDINNLAATMVSDKLSYDLNTCYGNETYVDYNISKVEVMDKTYNADMAHLLGQKYAKEYTLDGTSRCTYEEVAEAIETAINDFSNNKK